MKLSPSKENLSSPGKKRFGKAQSLFACVAIILILIAFSLGIFSGIFLSQEKGWEDFYKYVKNVSVFFDALSNYFEGFLAKPEKIFIDITFKDLQKIAFIRQIAIEQTVLPPSQENQYVPAKISHKGKVYDAKIRLKGDVFNRRKFSRKWPFRIIMKGGETLFGMKIFQIQHPGERNYLYEWLWHKAMRREGIIAMRYDFIDVTMNGEYLGIFALEEHFDKRLLENNERREGPIVVFSENAEIETIGHFGLPSPQHVPFTVAEIDVSRRKEVLADPRLKEQMLHARALLEGFRQGELGLNEVFDVRQMAKYYALLDLFNGRHAAKYGNFRFYYNPITAKLEPISYDAETVGDEQIFRDGLFMENWFRSFFNPTQLFFMNPHFFKLYFQELERLTSSDYLNRLFDNLDSQIRKNLKVIHKDHPYFFFNKNTFYEKQAYIRKLLTIPVLVNAYFKNHIKDSEQNILELDIVNIRFFPVQIKAVRLSDGTILPTEAQVKFIPPNLPYSKANVETVRFVIPENYEWKESSKEGLEVISSYPGLEREDIVKVIPWVYYDTIRIEESLVRNVIPSSQIPFIDVDQVKREVRFKPGKWTLGNNITIAKNYSAIIPEGTTIDLINHAKIISYDPIHFLGSKENPIVIGTSDKTGQGIAVMNARAPSILENVIFDNLASLSHGAWQLTGAVNFYNSPVTISRCKFLNIRAEDALNVVHSDFQMSDSRFLNAAADALDIDFSDGKIMNTAFESSGNDAIDISGSSVSVENANIVQAKDKGISAGEKSRVVIRNTNIRKTETAIASKDLSVVHIESAKISDSKIGYAAFQKKSEFGPGTIISGEVVFNNVDNPYQIEPGSTLQLNAA